MFSRLGCPSFPGEGVPERLGLRLRMGVGVGGMGMMDESWRPGRGSCGRGLRSPIGGVGGVLAGAGTALRMGIVAF